MTQGQINQTPDEESTPFLNERMNVCASDCGSTWRQFKNMECWTSFLNMKCWSKFGFWFLVIMGFYIVCYFVAIIITGGFLWGYQYNKDCRSYFAGSKAINTNGRVIEKLYSNQTGKTTVFVMYELGNAVIIPTSDSSTQLYTTDHMNTNYIRLDDAIPITFIQGQNASFVYYGQVYDVWLQFIMLEKPIATMFVSSLILAVALMVILPCFVLFGCGGHHHH